MSLMPNKLKRQLCQGNSLSQNIWTVNIWRIHGQLPNLPTFPGAKVSSVRYKLQQFKNQLIEA